jgi:hypothetical protein
MNDKIHRGPRKEYTKSREKQLLHPFASLPPVTGQIRPMDIRKRVRPPGYMFAWNTMTISI